MNDNELRESINKIFNNHLGGGRADVIEALLSLFKDETGELLKALEYCSDIHLSHHKKAEIAKEALKKWEEKG